MNVAFIHYGDASMASFRYRALMPVSYLNDQGFTATINEGEADAIVFSKPAEANIELAKQCKEDGTRVIVDICDDHLDHEKMGAVYRELIGLSDQVICPTKTLQERIAKETGKDSEVIPDPYEQQRRIPHAKGENLLWFGHQRNIPEIIPFIGKLPNLSVCTGRNNTLTGYIPWSLENQEKELAYANIVVLPKSAEYKSPNRLINSLMAGCFVVAHPNQSRQEFRKYTWIGRVLSGLEWANAFQDELNDRVSEAQDYIEAHYSPECIGKQWAEIL